MPEPVSLLMLQFLDWVSSRPRTYAESMDAWRSSCPRLTVWEDALIDGLIQVDSGPPLQQPEVTLTPRGRAFLNRKQAQQSAQTGRSKLDDGGETRMTVACLITELKQAYASAGLDCGDGLLPPADESAIDLIAEELAMPVPAELREVYRVHGGQEYVSPGTTGLFGQHRLHTSAEVLEHHGIYCENCMLDPLPAFPPPPDEWGSWVPQLMPFASWDAYDLCLHSESGEVWEFIPNTGLIRHRPNIAAVLREVLAAVRSGSVPQLGTLRGPT